MPLVAAMILCATCVCASRNKPQRCHVLPQAFDTDIEAKAAMLQVWSKVRKQFGLIEGFVEAEKGCPDALAARWQINMPA